MSDVVWGEVGHYTDKINSRQMVCPSNLALKNLLKEQNIAYLKLKERMG
jgi:hypothetical protein